MQETAIVFFDHGFDDVFVALNRVINIEKKYP